MSRKQIDWESLEIQYRAGIRSLKDIGGEYGVSDAAIIKRAKRDGWTRDLTAKIQARAEAKVSAAAVSAEVRALTKIAEKEIVEANAEMQAQVILHHRGDIRRYRSLSNKLLAELEAVTDGADLLAQLAESVKQDSATKAEAIRKVASVSSRVDSVKKLADTLKTLVALEREAFGIEITKSAGQTLEEFLDGIATAAS